MPFLSTSAVTVYCRRLLLPHIIRSSGRSSRRSSSQLLQFPIHQNYYDSIRSVRLFSTSPAATTSTLTSTDNDTTAKVSNRKPRVVILGRYVLLLWKVHMMCSHNFKTSLTKLQMPQWMGRFYISTSIRQINIWCTCHITSESFPVHTITT